MALLLSAVRTRFFDKSNKPLAGGKVYTYEANSTEPKDTWSDNDLTVPNPNPIELDMEGTAYIYLDGNYRIRVEDQYGVLIEDNPFVQSFFSKFGLSAEFVWDGSKNQHEINTEVKTDIDKFKKRSDGIFYAVDYGLKESNTAYQNTIALQQLSSAVNTNSGGHLVFPSGNFSIGHQELAGSNDKGGSWLYSLYLNINNCTKPVHLDFNQTIFKFKDGMRHGAFDPITGDAVTSGGNDEKYRAGYGRALDIRDNAEVLITGQFRVDGNDGNAIVGGTYGDTGRQNESYGIFAIGNKILKTDGLFVLHNIPLDGLYVTSQNQVDSVTDINGVISLKNARQALSLTGGWNQTYSNCYFGKTGKGNFPPSAPSANLDLEAELTSGIKNISFNNCTFSDAVGGSIISEFASAGEVSFNNCLVENRYNVAIYCKSNLTFNDCKINGKVEPFYSRLEDKPARMFNCSVSHLMEDGSQAYMQGALFSDAGETTSFVSLENLTIDYDFNNANDAIMLYLASKGLVKNLTLNVKGNPANISPPILVQLNGLTKIDGFMLNDKSQYVGALPDLRKAVSGLGLPYVSNAFITKNPAGDENVLWNDVYYSAGGRSGWWAGANIDRQGEQLEAKELSVLKNRYGTQSYNGGGQILSSSSAMPTSGWYRFGTIIFNANPSIGQPLGWICTTEGTAGVDAVFAKLPNIVAI
ncbi:TPA: hypothetical protein U2H88_003525 [Acinetobacter nosocomialis]|nr:hypothetical protein [Acinetobacter nosocomialis]